MKKLKDYKKIKVNNGFSNLELIQTICSCNAFLYYSYDHKKALEEYRKCDRYKEERKWINNPQSYDMPKELIEKYKIKKIGKLREIHFASNGIAWRFKIGNKYAKTYFTDDFGVNVFPLILK